jgi:general stress protein 26
MSAVKPKTSLDARFSDSGASATAWADAEAALEAAQLAWVVTVRADGSPHVTPLVAVWLDGALYFCTGPGEQKTKNLERNPRCTLMTGCNTWDQGLDLVVEGAAVRVTDEVLLQRLADEWARKWDGQWQFEVQDGMFAGEGNEAYVFEVAPVTAFGYGKGKSFSQTRWRF